MMTVSVITPPAYEPVSLAEARLWCRIDDDSQDAVVMLLIAAMREYAEDITGRAFVPRTLEAQLDAFPESSVIELPFPPLRSVTSISYTDSDGGQALDVSPIGWREDTASEPGRVSPLTSWPATDGDVLGAVRIRYVAGYTNVNSIPKKVRTWMQARLATLFEQREQLVTGTIVQALPRDFVDGLLDTLRVRKGFV